jgi:hypothetical protein
MEPEAGHGETEVYTTKVVRAAFVAGLLITTEEMVAEVGR